MIEKNYSDFGKQVKIRLIEIDKNAKWLCGEVASSTGKYFDESLLSKICTGKNKNYRFINVIKDILKI